MPRLAGGKDLITQPLYDTLQYPAAGTAAPLRFFAVPLGQGTTLFGTGGKNLSDTNMRQASQLPSPWTFEVYTLSVSLLSIGADTVLTNVSDLRIIYNQAHVVFTIGSKAWLESPIYYLPSGGGISGVGADPARALQYTGSPSPNDVFKLSRTLTILENENFDVQLIMPAGTAVTTAVNIRVALGGELARSIQ